MDVRAQENAEAGLLLPTQKYLNIRHILFIEENVIALVYLLHEAIVVVDLDVKKFKDCRPYQKY